MTALKSLGGVPTKESVRKDTNYPLEFKNYMKNTYIVANIFLVLLSLFLVWKLGDLQERIDQCYGEYLFLLKNETRI